MIRFRLRELLGERSLYWLATEADVHWATVAAMAKGRSRRVDLEVLEAICRALECQPGDLLVIVQSRKARKRGKK